MTNREWLLNKMKNMSDEEFAKMLNESTYICDLIDCQEDTAENCENCALKWLKKEYKKKVKLTQAERTILENVDKYYKWICRDEDGNLYVYSEKPTKGSLTWKTDFDYMEFVLFKHLFESIKWEDEPYNIRELLEG